MFPEAFPDELVHQIVAEFHSSSVADKEFYMSRRRPERRKGIHWTHDHLTPISIVNHQFRRVCLPILHESVDTIAKSDRNEDMRQYHTDIKRFINLISLRKHISVAIK
jgi:hypothetical protein